RLFEQRHAEAHDDRTVNLVGCCLGVDDAAGVDRRHDAGDAQPGGGGGPADFDAVGAEGAYGEAFGFVAGFGVGFTRNVGEARGLQGFGDGGGVRAAGVNDDAVAQVELSGVG